MILFLKILVYSVFFKLCWDTFLITALFFWTEKQSVKARAEMQLTVLFNALIFGLITASLISFLKLAL